ncbi:MAG TPA: hypothetical protein VHB70_08225 [Parafilimonas sp.]|nr:hypothetical protein [Parafilimonas sp.]
MNLQHINYDDLNPRQKERYNFHKIAAVLADYGYSSIKLDDDWQGADFIAQHFKTKNFISVQLKGRLTFAKKYVGKELYIAFPFKNEWYVYDHDELLNEFLKTFKDNMAVSASWIADDGFYTWNKLSQQILKLLEPYKLKPLSQAIPE